jgi:hypothetical protein
LPAGGGRPSIPAALLSNHAALLGTDPFSTPFWTVALPKIRGDLRPFAVAVGLPRNLLCLNGIHIILYSHDENLTISAQNRKTYRRFFRCDFFRRGFIDACFLKPMTYNAINLKKTKKRAAKASNIFPRTPVFLQKRPEKIRFYVSTKLSQASCSLKRCGLGNCVDSWNRVF